MTVKSSILERKGEKQKSDSQARFEFLRADVKVALNGQSSRSLIHDEKRYLRGKEEKGSAQTQVRAEVFRRRPE